MRSVNGTYVDGQQITRSAILSSGDTLAIHDSQFMVLKRGQAATERTCPQCGASVRARYKFCSECGSQVA